MHEVGEQHGLAALHRIGIDAGQGEQAADRSGHALAQHRALSRFRRRTANDLITDTDNRAAAGVIATCRFLSRLIRPPSDPNS